MKQYNRNFLSKKQKLNNLFRVEFLKYKKFLLQNHKEEIDKNVLQE